MRTLNAELKPLNRNYVCGLGPLISGLGVADWGTGCLSNPVSKEHPEAWDLSLGASGFRASRF